jgi:hypothetical protein
MVIFGIEIAIEIGIEQLNIVAGFDCDPDPDSGFFLAIPCFKLFDIGWALTIFYPV